MLPLVLEGYARGSMLPADHMKRIRLWTLLIGVRRLGRRAIRQPDEASEDLHLAAIRRILVVLANG